MMTYYGIFENVLASTTSFMQDLLVLIEFKPNRSDAGWPIAREAAGTASPATEIVELVVT